MVLLLATFSSDYWFFIGFMDLPRNKYEQIQSKRKSFYKLQIVLCDRKPDRVKVAWDVLNPRQVSPRDNL